MCLPTIDNLHYQLSATYIEAVLTLSFLDTRKINNPSAWYGSLVFKTFGAICCIICCTEVKVENDDMESVGVPFNKAQDLTNGEITYANVVRATVSTNEVLLDFYFAASHPIEDVTVQFLKRIVLPLSVAKQTISVLDNIVSDWEGSHGVSLPFELNQSSEGDE